MTAFVDSVVLIDLLRSYPPAVSWLEAQPKLAITPVVWLEVLYGAPNTEARNRALQLLRHFERTDLLPADFDWAIEQTIRFRLSHNVDPMDCLIASVAFRLKKPLYTQNLKHFGPMLGPLVRKPYYTLERGNIVALPVAAPKSPAPNPTFPLDTGEQEALISPALYPCSAPPEAVPVLTTCETARGGYCGPRPRA